MINILDLVNNSKFLNKMYPCGIERVAINKIDYIKNNFGFSTIYLYSDQKPSIELEKYGCWEKDYNCIVIELSCKIISLELSENKADSLYSQIKIKAEENKYILSQHNENGTINISIQGGLIFQRINAYFHDHQT